MTSAGPPRTECALPAALPHEDVDLVVTELPAGVVRHRVEQLRDACDVLLAGDDEREGFWSFIVSGSPKLLKATILTVGEGCIVRLENIGGARPLQVLIGVGYWFAFLGVQWMSSPIPHLFLSHLFLFSLSGCVYFKYALFSGSRAASSAKLKLLARACNGTLPARYGMLIHSMAWIEPVPSQARAHELPTYRRGPPMGDAARVVRSAGVVRTVDRVQLEGGTLVSLRTYLPASTTAVLALAVVTMLVCIACLSVPLRPVVVYSLDAAAWIWLILACARWEVARRSLVLGESPETRRGPQGSHRA